MAKDVSTATSAKPGNSDFLNLDDYLENGGSVPFSSTPLAANVNYVPLTSAGSISDGDGFQAEAFASTNAAGQVTSSSQVIIAYKEDDPTANPPPTEEKLLSDSAALLGLHASASAKFADQVLTQTSALGINNSHVFVTGQSLGGADAEYAARATGLGGETFGAPGIKGTGTDKGLTNYVDAVDPIGNYSVDQPWGQAVSLALGQAITLSLKGAFAKLPAALLKKIPQSLQDKTGTALTNAVDKLLSFNHFGTTVTLNSTSKLLPAFKALTASLQSAASSNTSSLASVKTALGIPLITLLTKPPYKYTVGPVSVAGKGDFNSIEQYAKDLDVTLYPVCFASGTRIRTARGDVVVETLRVGDRVVTAAGRLRAVRWLGHRTLDCRNHTHPAGAMPIRIAAHAFGASRPSRDLDVSPGHAVCVDVMGEVLVPAVALVNGTSVRQVACDEVTYWHVELDSHDVILAENLPTESYLEMGNRRFFREAGVVALGAAPDARGQSHADFCRPYHDRGSVVDAVRAMLEAKAAPHVPEDDVAPRVVRSAA